MSATTEMLARRTALLHAVAAEHDRLTLLRAEYGRALPRSDRQYIEACERRIDSLRQAHRDGDVEFAEILALAGDLLGWLEQHAHETAST